MQRYLGHVCLSSLALFIPCKTGLDALPSSSRYMQRSRETSVFFFERENGPHRRVNPVEHRMVPAGSCSQQLPKGILSVSPVTPNLLPIPTAHARAVEAEVGLAIDSPGPLEHAAWLRSRGRGGFEQLETPSKQRHLLDAEQDAGACPACGHCSARQRTFNTPRVIDTPGRSSRHTSTELQRSFSSGGSPSVNLSSLARELKMATQEDIRDRIHQLILTRDFLARPGATEEDARDARILEIKIAASEAMLTDLWHNRVESTYTPTGAMPESKQMESPLGRKSERLDQSSNSPIEERTVLSVQSTASSASDARTANAAWVEDPDERGSPDSSDFVIIPEGHTLQHTTNAPPASIRPPLPQLPQRRLLSPSATGSLHGRCVALREVRRPLQSEGSDVHQRTTAVTTAAASLHALMGAADDRSDPIARLPDMDDVLRGRVSTPPRARHTPISREDSPSTRASRSPMIPRATLGKSPRVSAPFMRSTDPSDAQTPRVPRMNPARQEPATTLATPRNPPVTYLWDSILTWG